MNKPVQNIVQAPQWSVATNFIDALHGASDPALCLQVFDDTDAKDFTKARVRHGKLSNAEVRRWLLSSAANTCGIFFAVNKIKPGAKRRKEFVTGYVALPLDLDGAPLPDKWLIEPDAINETSPGRFHCYWFLKPGTDLPLWVATVKALAARYGGDPSIAKTPGVLRIPGFFNQKRIPFRIRMIKLDQFSERHDLAEFAAAHDVDLESVDIPSGTSSDRTSDEFDNERDLVAVKLKLKETNFTKGERNNTAFKLAAFMDDHAISRELQLELLQEWNDSQDDPLPPGEIESCIDHAPEYKSSSTGSQAAVDPKDDFANDPIDPDEVKIAPEVEPEAKPKTGRFKAMSMATLETLPPLEWLIDGIIPKGQLVELYGPPKAGKTFAAIDQGLCIATNTPYHGKAVIQGRVMHIVAEGNRAAVRDRVKAWIETRAKDKAHKAQLRADIEKNWCLVGLPVHIDVPSVRKEFLADNPGKFDLVIVDTMLRNMAGHISDPKDMARFVRACDAIREHYTCAVIVVHHEGKDRSKGGMGSVAMDAAVDAILVFRRDGKKRTLRVKEIRDGSSDQPDMIFELEIVSISIDPDTMAETTSAALKLVATKAKEGPSPADKLLVAIYESDNPNGKDLAAGLNITKQAISKTAADLRKLGYLGDGWKLTKHGEDAAQIALGLDDEST